MRASLDFEGSRALLLDAAAIGRLATAHGVAERMRCVRDLARAVRFDDPDAACCANA